MPMKLQLTLADRGTAVLESGRRVGLDPEMRRRVEELLGPGALRLISTPPKSSPPPQNGRNGRERRG